MIYLTLIVGLVILLLGANYLVVSSASIARRVGISDFVVGFTIVGIGTSAPELFVSISSAFNGLGDVSIGNVVGSNVCNTLLILGATSIMRPVMIESSNLKRDIPLSVVVSVLLAGICYFGVVMCGDAVPGVSRFGGVILVLGFVAFMVYNIRRGRVADNNIVPVSGSVWLSVLLAVVSLAALIYGGNLFLDSAVSVARLCGVSDFVISTTVVALGTSLPELVTCVIAAIRGNGALALGNVLGSNIFNVLMVVGAAATISPIVASGVTAIDFAVVILSGLLVAVCAFTGGRKRVERYDGVVLVAIYIAYTVYLIVR